MNLDEKNVKAVITDKVHIGKKCAIYNRLSISDDKQLILKKKRTYRLLYKCIKN